MYGINDWVSWEARPTIGIKNLNDLAGLAVSSSAVIAQSLDFDILLALDLTLPGAVGLTILSRRLHQALGCVCLQAGFLCGIFCVTIFREQAVLGRIQYGRF